MQRRVEACDWLVLRINERFSVLQDTKDFEKDHNVMELIAKI